jgi:hypothetical protein
MDRFPEFQHCLICEGVRLERFRKVTVLGLYGLAPDVEILVKDFGQPFEKLSFLLLGGLASGKFKSSFQILDESGSAIVSSPESELTFEETTRRQNLVLAVGNLLFPREGTYLFRVFFNGRLAFERAFRVLKGQDADFV